jgi:hypothetical protein
MIVALILFSANCKQGPGLIGMFQPKPDGSRKHCAQSLFRIVQFGLLFTVILTRDMSRSRMAMNRTRICDSEVHGVQIGPLFGLLWNLPFRGGQGELRANGDQCLLMAELSREIYRETKDRYRLLSRSCVRLTAFR